MKKLVTISAIIFLSLLGVNTNAKAVSSTPAGFEDLAGRMLPSVVNVSTTKTIKIAEKRNMPSFPSGTPFDELFKRFYNQIPKNATPQDKPQVERKISVLGSGFVIDAKNGYIVTNNHVIKGADTIKVILDDNTSLDAKLIGRDKKTDIALLKVKTDKKLVESKWGDSDKLRIGAWVLAIGNPFGLGGTVTAGIVSARHRNINSGPYDEYIQTDASINKGNSGGPMFNTAGEVVGINTAIYSPTGGSVGIGFAIPSNMAKSVVDQLIKYGKTKRGWLGVRIQNVTAEIAENLGLDKAKGAMVAGVNPEGPAKKYNIKSGDIILKFNGHDVDKMHNLPRLVAQADVGKRVEVVIWRKGKIKKVYVVLGQLEKAEENGLLKNKDKNKNSKNSKTDSLEIKSLGFSISSLNGVLRKKYKISKKAKGVIITEVKSYSTAAEKGLLPGDIISEINQQEVTKPKEIKAIISKAKKEKKSSVLLFISRGDNMRFLALKFKKAK